MASVMTAPSQSEDDVLVQGRNRLARGEPIAVSTVIDTWGSAPVPVGGRLVVGVDQSFCGSVSGGCVENDVIVAAGDVIASGCPKSLTFGVSDETAWSVGLPCGGSIRIFVERYVGSDDQAYFDQLIKARQEREPLLVEIALIDGRRKVWQDNDSTPEDYRDRLRKGHSEVIQSESDEIFLHAVTPAPRIVVVGGTHIGQALVQMAELAGYNVVVVDPRSSYVSEDRFPGVRAIQDWPCEALASMDLDPYTAVVALAHVRDIDDEALKTALASSCGYVGALGSRRNHAKRVDRLATADVPQQQIDRIHSPIGLDIGAHKPEEIAVAILAEIIRTFRGPKWQ